MTISHRESYSSAFKEYLDNRKNILCLLKAVPTDSEQLGSIQKRRLANTIYCSCVVLLTSYLERYIESLVVESIDGINSSNLPLQSIPDSLLVVQVKESLEALTSKLQKDLTKDNVFQMVLASQQLSITHEWFLKEADVFDKLSGEPLIGENRFSNPTPAKIDELFRHFGIGNLVGRAIGLEGKPDRGVLPDKTKEMIEKRNNVAHTGGTVVITKQDIRDYLIYSRRLARSIDLIVGQEIQKITGGSWPWV